MGEPEKAKQTLLEGLNQCQKEKSKMLLSLAWLEEDAFDNTEVALDLITKAMKIERSNVRVYIAKANLELRQGNLITNKN